MTTAADILKKYISGYPNLRTLSNKKCDSLPHKRLSWMNYLFEAYRTPQKREENCYTIDKNLKVQKYKWL